MEIRLAACIICLSGLDVHRFINEVEMLALRIVFGGDVIGVAVTSLRKVTLVVPLAGDSSPFVVPWWYMLVWWTRW